MLLVGVRVRYAAFYKFCFFVVDGKLHVYLIIFVAPGKKAPSVGHIWRAAKVSEILLSRGNLVHSQNVSTILIPLFLPQFFSKPIQIQLVLPNEEKL
jgi:hypothetical protein